MKKRCPLSGFNGPQVDLQLIPRILWSLAKEIKNEDHKFKHQIYAFIALKAWLAKHA